MNKKFDVDKFLSILFKSKDESLLLNYEIEKAGYKDFILLDTGKDNERYIFTDIDRIEDDFKFLDSSFIYSPIFHLRDTPEPDDGGYFYKEEYSLITSKKSEYSLLLLAEDYNHSAEVNVIKVFKNIKKNEIKNLSTFPLSKDRTDSIYCKWIFLNNAYEWSKKSEIKDIENNKLPKSLKDTFVPVVKNKIKDAKETGTKKKDLRNINSMIAILDEKKIKDKSWRPFKNEKELKKNEVWDFVFGLEDRESKIN